MKTSTAKLFFLVSILILFVGGLSLRVYRESCSALSEGRVALKAGIVHSAIDSLSAAVTWRAPGITCAQEAGEVLIQAIPSFSQASLRIEGYRRLRSAVIASRSFPQEEFLSLRLRSEDGLREEGVGEARAIVDPTSLEIPFFYNCVRGFLFLGWIGATLTTLWFGFTKEGKVVILPFIRGGTAALFFYSVWLFSLT